MSNQPRPEHPRPQFVRDNWAVINGEWEFEFDHSDDGAERGLRDRPLTGSIVVPFAPESQLSGIDDPSFHEAVWYRRHVTVPDHWPRERVILHFQAVDHDATVWVNGVEVVRHRGGFSPFSADITDALDSGRSGTVVVRARDHRDAVQARGKQATWEANTHAFYTRTTGIWQTVWIESVSELHAQRARILTDVTEGTVELRVPLSVQRAGAVIRARISDNAGVIDVAERSTGVTLDPVLRLQVPAERLRPWCPEDPHLYDIDIEVDDAAGVTVDRVRSYIGIRSIAIDGQRMLLNGKPVFQRLVLDQGYWPESLMTAPTDAALERDIRLSMEAGFNGARVHEKVAEERYLFHADRMGYLVWGEFADWGASGQGPEGDNQRPTPSYIAQWIEVLDRDFNHPSIVGWCPLNETYQLLHDRITVLDDVTAGMYWATKRIDPSRPVIDASGYSHRVRETDVWDSHDYEQDPTVFANNHAGLERGAPFANTLADGRHYSTPYEGQPFMVSEFGGIWWAPEIASRAGGDSQEESWGYGQRVTDESEFYERFAALVSVLDRNPLMFGYCYTQLTDVFQEQNGLYTFDRGIKLDIERLRSAQQGVPAYEAERSNT